MVRRKSLNAQNIDTQVTEAVLGVQSGKYKSLYEAAKLLGLSARTVTCRVKGGLSRSQARQQQQKLSPTQEKVLLKWIKELTISGYSPGYWLLKEIAKELRSKQTYNLDNLPLNPIRPLLQFKLGQS